LVPLADINSEMPTVDTTVWINAPLEKVYAIARDSETYPEYMKDVKSVTPVSREGNRFVADWVGVVPTFGLKVRWRQEELWDDAHHSSRFRQLEGDYDMLQGTWTFRSERGGTQFDQHLDYEYNVPTLGPLVKKVILSVVQKNLENINEAFKKRAEGG
jgi:ribosome-associated toxin RatA of RatAB toxin-antitoxin module